MPKLKLLFVAALSGVIGVAVAASTAYVQKSLGDASVKLPLQAGFPAACEESKPFAERAASLTPKSSIFVTCFLPQAKWRLLQEGKPTDLYPYITVTVDPAHPSGPFTRAEFLQLRKASHAELGDLQEISEEAQAKLQAQDTSNAERGGDLKRENYKQKLSGFFDVPSRLDSFSYLTSRSARVSEGGVTKDLCEVNAVTTVLYSGRLLRVLVIDACQAGIRGERARAITASWLAALSDLSGERK